MKIVHNGSSCTYGHLKMTYIRDDAGNIVGYDTGDRAYSVGIGHGLEFDFPDVAAYRPELATAFIKDAFSQFGGTDESLRDTIITTAVNRNLPWWPSMENIYKARKQDYLKEGYFKGLDKDQINFNPYDDNFKPKEGPLPEIKPEVMVELLEKIIMECAGK
jgi:hypothetical protein